MDLKTPRQLSELIHSKHLIKLKIIWTNTLCIWIFGPHLQCCVGILLICLSLCVYIYLSKYKVKGWLLPNLVVVYNMFCVKCEKILNHQWKDQKTGYYFKDSIGLVATSTEMFLDQWSHTGMALASQCRESHHWKGIKERNVFRCNEQILISNHRISHRHNADGPSKTVLQTSFFLSIFIDSIFFSLFSWTRKNKSRFPKGRIIRTKFFLCRSPLMCSWLHFSC